VEAQTRLDDLAARPLGEQGDAHPAVERKTLRARIEVGRRRFEGLRLCDARVAAVVLDDGGDIDTRRRRRALGRRRRQIDADCPVIPAQPF